MDGGVLTRHDTGSLPAASRPAKSSPHGEPGRTVSFPNDTGAARLPPSRSPSPSSRLQTARSRHADQAVPWPAPKMMSGWSGPLTTGNPGTSGHGHCLAFVSVTCTAPQLT